MLTYSANFVSVSSLICSPLNSQPSAAIGAIPIRNTPYAPRMQQVLLPSPSHQLPHTWTDPGIFPLDILATLSLLHQTELWDIELRSPVHIHTPVAHIATLSGAFPGQIIQALDVFLFLQDFANKPIDYLQTFSSLSHHMQTLVNQAFRTRRTEALRCHVEITWQLYASGQRVQQGQDPLGIDLLLGNSQVWGFEDRSYSGHSIVHVAGGDIDAQRRRLAYSTD